MRIFKFGGASVKGIKNIVEVLQKKLDVMMCLL